MAEADIIAAKIKDRSLTEDDIKAVPPENFLNAEFIKAVTVAASLQFGDDEPDQVKPLFDSRLYRAALVKFAEETTTSGLPLIDRLAVPLKTALRDADPRKKATLERVCAKLFSTADLQNAFSPNTVAAWQKAFPSFRTTTGVGPENPGG